MTPRRKSFVTLALFATLGAAGCSDNPHGYGKAQPDVDSLDRRDRGLQSKNVIQASDEMAQDLLALPALADSPTQWTIVVNNMENQSSNRRINFDIFLDRLKTNLATQGHGRIRLITNRDKYRDLQSRELEGENPRPGPAGTQPQFSLNGKVTDLPNRGTTYYYFTFELDDLRSRDQAWQHGYEVKVER